MQQATLANDLKANDRRQDYLRARTFLRGGERFVEAFPVQDSSMLSVLAAADALIIRAPGAQPAAAGQPVQILALDD